MSALPAGVSLKRHSITPPLSYVLPTDEDRERERRSRNDTVLFRFSPSAPPMGGSCLAWIELTSDELRSMTPVTIRLVQPPGRLVRLTRRLFGRRAAIRLAART